MGNTAVYVDLVGFCVSQSGVAQFNMKPEDNMDKARRQVNDVTDIMRGNMNKIMEREGKLEELELKADQLQIESQQFQKTTVKVKRKAFLENMKMKIAIGGVVCVVIIVIIIIIAT